MMFCELVEEYFVFAYSQQSHSLNLPKISHSPSPCLHSTQAASHGTGAVEYDLRDLSALHPGALNRNPHYMAMHGGRLGEVSGVKNLY